MKKISFILRAIRSYMIFFLIVAFAVTCCMLLFLNTMQSVSGLELTKENISVAAKATFFNVILISLVFCVIDYVRRRFTVDRPVKRIIEAAEKVMDGDFTVRIDKRRTMDSDGLDTVIGERGIGLSEGQAQRIAVARAVLSGAPILLLDESTSALDEETEAMLLQNIASLKEKTCLIVTHRRAALQICNYRIHIKNAQAKKTEIATANETSDIEIFRKTERNL